MVTFYPKNLINSKNLGSFDGIMQVGFHEFSEQDANLPLDPSIRK